MLPCLFFVVPITSISAAWLFPPTGNTFRPRSFLRCPTTNTRSLFCGTPKSLLLQFVIVKVFYPLLLTVLIPVSSAYLFTYNITCLGGAASWKDYILLNSFTFYALPLTRLLTLAFGVGLACVKILSCFFVLQHISHIFLSFPA